jgi:hypothetical protein
MVSPTGNETCVVRMRYRQRSIQEGMREHTFKNTHLVTRVWWTRTCLRAYQPAYELCSSVRVYLRDLSTRTSENLRDLST